jgi:DNA-binding NtrC family response regulator
MRDLHRSLLLLEGRDLHTPWLDLDLAGSSDAVEQLRDNIRDAARGENHILFEGPPGTAKHRLARLVHMLGVRAERMLVIFNPQGLGAEDCSSSLFGPSVPGQGQLRQGLMDKARDGSLVIEEIDQLNLVCQRTLLDHLDGPLRLLATSSMDLEAASRRGTFDSELFERLKPGRIRVPRLEERREDIPSLFRMYLRHYGERYRMPVRDVDPDVERFLVRHSWKGQLRELRSVTEMAVLRAQGTRMTLADFHLGGMEAHNLPQNYKQAKKIIERDFKRRFLGHLLEKSKGKVGKAAELAGIPRPSFSNMLREVDLVAAEFKRKSASKSG